MGYGDNDPYMDEDGEPLMDPDAQSDREASPEPIMDFLDDDDVEEDWRRERSPTPVHDSGMDYGGKARKRLVKKSARESTPESGGSPYGAAEGLDDWEEHEPSSSKKRKAPSMSSKEGKRGSGKKEKMKSKPERMPGKSAKSGSKGYGGLGDRGRDSELNEMWNTVAGGDSEDDQEGVRTVDDDAFIDDNGLNLADRFGSDNEAGSVGDAPQAEEGEEDEEIKQLFKGGKKKKKNEKSPAELALVVEHLMAELEVTAEEDAELNRQSKPAINKLKKLPLLIEVLSKKNLQQEFLDHGVLTLLKNWLEPLPDGSLPNMNIRTAILKILTDFPIDLEQYDRREQLKKSGLGKVIMFLSKSDEETTANRRLAKDLVDKWSRPIFNKSTRFEDMRAFDDERVPYRRPSMKKPVTKTAGLESRDDDLDEFSQGPKSGQSASRQHASRPEPLPLDFVVRPQSKIDPEEVRARAKQVAQDQRRIKAINIEDAGDPSPVLQSALPVSHENEDVGLLESTEEALLHIANPDMEGTRASPSSAQLVAPSPLGNKGLVPLGTTELIAPPSASSLPASSETLEESIPKFKPGAETFEEVAASQVSQDIVSSNIREREHVSTQLNDFPGHGIEWPDAPQMIPFVGAEMMLNMLINGIRALFQQDTPSVEVVQNALRSSTRAYHALGLPKEPWMNAVDSTWEEFRRLHEASRWKEYSSKIQELEATISMLTGQLEGMQLKAAMTRSHKEVLTIEMTMKMIRASKLHDIGKALMDKSQNLLATSQSIAEKIRQMQTEEATLTQGSTDLQGEVLAVQTQIEELKKNKPPHLMNKKLQQLKAPKKKQLQATKLSVEGRGMVKYL